MMMFLSNIFHLGIASPWHVSTRHEQLSYHFGRSAVQVFNTSFVLSCRQQAFVVHGSKMHIPRPNTIQV